VLVNGEEMPMESVKVKLQTWDQFETVELSELIYAWKNMEYRE